MNISKEIMDPLIINTIGDAQKMYKWYKFHLSVQLIRSAVKLEESGCA